MSGRLTPHWQAVLLALFVTVLWSTSWVLIKIGLKDLPALTFAGLRYTLAFLCLLPLMLRPAGRASLRALSGRDWGQLAVLGLAFYTATQGAQFLALERLPAVTLSLLLNFSVILVVLAGPLLLSERLTVIQWGGTGLFLLGVFVYFYPILLPVDQVTGLIFGLSAVLANAASSILGRRVNREQRIPATTVTVVSMGVGALALLSMGILVDGIPEISPLNWLFIVWLALVNTALAFTLWNHTLRTLSAVESNLINNTMLIQIAVLAWVFLDEAIAPREGIGLAIAALGIVIVQLTRTRRVRAAQPT